MATVLPSRTSTQLPSTQSRTTTTTKRKKDQPRNEIWTSLLRQTRLAQARSRTQTLQHRSLLLLGGSPADQQSFAERYLARPPPPAPPSTNAASRESERRRKGEVRLSNRFAYGYGHVTLFSPPQQGVGGGNVLGGEAEEVAGVDVHCLAGAPEGGYEGTLRKVLVPQRDVERSDQEEQEVDAEMLGQVEGEEGEGRRPSIVILMSWKRPWEFLDTLRRWIALLARALLSAEARKDENPVEVLKEYGVNLSVVLQHVEAQEDLERENYKDDTFDYISQCLRTCLLPLSAGLVYMPSAAPPTQPGAPLNDVQKVIYASLGLNVAALQPRTGARPGSSSGVQQKTKEDLLPKHNVVDRMAIVVPSGWDSAGKIRLLSETFSPEALMEGWVADLDQAATLYNPPQPTPELPPPAVNEPNEAESQNVLQATGGAPEMYSSQPSPTISPIDDEVPLSPSKLPKSAIKLYEQAILDPNAHKKPKPPQLEVTTKPEQDFLAEMRAQLQQFEAQDAERQRKDPSGVHTTTGALSQRPSRDSSNAPPGSSGSALSELGDVSFNVGGVSYNTVSAEAAIERLKRPQHPSSSPGGESPGVASPRAGTPRPSRRERSGEEGTPGSSIKGELQTEKLEEYFASLMRRGGGGSAANTPSKAPPS